MAVTASQLIARVATEGVPESQQQLKSMGQTVSETSGGFKSMLGNALSFVAGQAIFNAVGQAVGFLKNQVSDSIGLAIQHQDVMEQTAKVLRSTGDASGMTQQSLEALASSLEKTTYFSKDTTEQGENLLLTFTNIGKDVFPQATQQMLNIAKAMGTDLKSAAVEEGKALNDPINGITALTRIGVTFTQQQKDQIKAMQDSGNMAGAQKIILQELNREFGGSADATQTFGGRLEILKNRLGDMKERIGSDLLPVLGNLMDHLASPALDMGEKLFHKVGDAVGYVWGVLKTVNLSDFLAAWKDLKFEIGELGRTFGDLGAKLHPVATDFDPLADKIQSLAKDGLKLLTDALWKAYEGLSAINGLFHGGKGPLEDFAKSVRGLVGDLQKGAASLNSEFGPQIKLIANLLIGQFSDSFKFAGKEASQISKWFAGSGIINDVAKDLKNLAHVTLDLSQIFLEARGVILDISEHAFAKFAPYIEKLLPVLTKLQVGFDTGVSQALQKAKPYIEEALKAFEKFANGVIDRVTPIIDKFMPYLIKGTEDVQKVWVAIWPYLEQILEGVFKSMGGFIQIAWDLITGIINIGLDLLSGNWKQAWTDMQVMLGGVWDGIKNVIDGGIKAAQGFMGGFNAWVDRQLVQPFRNALGEIGGIFGNIGKLIVDATSGNFGAISGDLHSLHIPGFAGGTSSAPGGLARLAENGAELITGPSVGYLPPGAKVYSAAQTAQMMSGGYAGGGGTLVLTIDGRAFARGYMPYHVQEVRNSTGLRF